MEKQNLFPSIVSVALAFLLCLRSPAQATPADKAQFTRAINRLATAPLDVKSLDDLPKAIKLFYQPDIDVFADHTQVYIPPLDSIFAKPNESSNSEDIRSRKPWRLQSQRLFAVRNSAGDSYAFCYRFASYNSGTNCDLFLLDKNQRIIKALRGSISGTPDLINSLPKLVTADKHGHVKIVPLRQDGPSRLPDTYSQHAKRFLNHETDKLDGYDAF